uniref:Uncharacterized protein n=1 Tax=Romanomermis culicivorax TaxID=13658 RepID=A0A915J6K4_ROMCU
MIVPTDQRSALAQYCSDMMTSGAFRLQHNDKSRNSQVGGHPDSDSVRVAVVLIPITSLTITHLFPIP